MPTEYRRPGFKSGSRLSFLFLSFRMNHEFYKLVCCLLVITSNIIGRVVKGFAFESEGQGSNPGQDKSYLYLSFLDVS